MRPFVCLLYCSFWLLPITLAHGPVHELIQKISEEIARDPQNASLYLQRGEYHRIDENFDAAFADFSLAERLDSSLQFPVAYQMAMLFAEHHYPQSGLIYINRFLDAYPQHVNGLVARAGLYKQLQLDSLAVEDFAAALANAKEPQPHLFLDIAKASLRADSSDFAEAHYWLQQGEQRLGFNIVLRSYAIDLYCLATDWDTALALIDDIISRLPRHEKWLLQKAQILEQAGRKSEAIATYQATLSAIEQLSRRSRSTRAVAEWQAQAILRLQALQAE